MIDPIPVLAELRDEVLLRSEKRKPKWGFRVAPDMIVELQPQPVSRLSELALSRGHRQRSVAFAGRSIMGDGPVPGEWLVSTPRNRDAVYWTHRFEVVGYEDDPDHWAVIHRGGSWSHKGNDYGFVELKRRTAEAFAGDVFRRLTPATMLRPACMICGRGLTDPASMARWIGPECAGTSRLLSPFMFTAEPCVDHLQL